MIANASCIHNIEEVEFVNLCGNEITKYGIKTLAASIQNRNKPLSNLNKNITIFTAKKLDIHGGQLLGHHNDFHCHDNFYFLEFIFLFVLNYWRFEYT